jgi:hypothetical protein
VIFALIAPDAQFLQQFAVVHSCPRPACRLLDRCKIDRSAAARSGCGISHRR